MKQYIKKTKVCITCGDEFTANHPYTQVYCRSCRYARDLEISHKAQGSKTREHPLGYSGERGYIFAWLNETSQYQAQGKKPIQEMSELHTIDGRHRL